MTKDDLIAFEQQVAEAFNAGRIRAPVHLAGGNEDVLIHIFKDIRPQDWVLTQWRSHYHCLLKGVPPDRLMADILAGRSITLTYPQEKIISSAIVGGIFPIAVGLAMGARRQGRDEFIWVFGGDMTFETGIATECMQYCARKGIENIRFVMEDNGKSVDTPTLEAWGPRSGTVSTELFRMYSYQLPYPHAGAGVRVNF